MLLEAADGACSEDVLGDELLNAGFADADEGKLGGDEEAVGQDEKRDRDGAKEQEAGHWLGASCGAECWRYGEGCEKPGFRHVLMIIDGAGGLSFCIYNSVYAGGGLRFTWDAEKEGRNLGIRR